MKLNRKDFLRQMGFGAAGLVAATSVLRAAGGGGSQPAELPKWTPNDAEGFWRKVRDQYEIDPELAYLNTGGLGAASIPVLRKFEEVMHKCQRTPQTGHEFFPKARRTMAKFFAVDPAEVCLTRNATEGNSIIAAGLGLKEGDEVIFESHAHPGGSFPWYNQHKQHGIVVKVFDPDPTSPEGNLARIRELITPRTKVIQVSHVTAPTGIVMPVAAIAKLAHEHGAWFHIDGAQSAGMFPFGLRDTGCDSFATSGHKWIGGPHETGVFYIRRDKLDAVAPVCIGAYSGELPFLPGELTYSPTMMRHEYATRSAASMLALAEAMKFQEAVGRQRIAEHGRALATRMRTGLSQIKDVEILTPTLPEMSGSILTFRSPKMDFEKLFSVLWQDHHLRCRPVSEQKLNAVRVSWHLFNSPEECDRLVNAVGDVLRKA